MVTMIARFDAGASALPLSSLILAAWNDGTVAISDRYPQESTSLRIYKVEPHTAACIGSFLSERLVSMQPDPNMTFHTGFFRVTTRTPNGESESRDISLRCADDVSIALQTAVPLDVCACDGSSLPPLTLRDWLSWTADSSRPLSLPFAVPSSWLLPPSRIIRISVPGAMP
ncbi:MAG: hypothetical protein J0L61_07220 [Planctomycetes bacterium]|nr:hypothetical protein [Planctomycetota bacterium]